MPTKDDEIAPRVYRLSTQVPDIGPDGFPSTSFWWATTSHSGFTLATDLFEESSSTLFCGDLFTHLGDGPALTDRDIVGPAVDAERIAAVSSLK